MGGWPSPDRLAQRGNSGCVGSQAGEEEEEGLPQVSALRDYTGALWELSERTKGHFEGSYLLTIQLQG